MRTFLFSFTVLCSIVTASIAAPPDLINGGVPNEDPAITFNLGPTGTRGWVYHVKIDTSESRQILITEVDSGSPADGILAVDDVILGADGTGADPVNFSSDARKSLALAIADAEARTSPTLKLLCWRGGTTSTVTLTLQTMGAYSPTAPYNCPKSTKILQDGLEYVYNNEDPGRYSFGAITLLADANSIYEAKARTEARALIPDQATMDQMMSDEQDTTGMICWQRGHVLIFLAEYYLATGDTQVLPAIEAYAVNIAKNTSLFGTTGHKYADKWPDGSPNGPMGGVYGVVNTPGLFCFLGVLLAKECGLTHPEIDPAIERASRFFAYYSGKGAIPYGEHEPYSEKHENNGKCGLTALAFMLQDNRVEEGKFFAKMSTASPNEREYGHTGAFFNYVWAPLGAAAGGEEAAAAHFSEISWLLDLSRCWDGRFQYDCLNGEGPKNGSDYNNFRMSTAVLLTYALPLRKLNITGKGHDPARWLSTADVVEAVAANDYDATSRNDSQLITDLSNWSPKVRRNAGIELGKRSINASELNQITAIANNTSASSGARAGACYALGKIANSSSAPVLAALLTDSDDYVRFMAAEGMRYLSTSDKLAHIDTILSAADTTSQPLYPMVEEDPLHFAHGRLGMLLFYSGNAYGPKGVISGSGINGVDRNLLYPAIEAISQTPVGQCRSTLSKTYTNLNYDDVLVLAGPIVDSIANRSPADKMFSGGVRNGGIQTLQKFDIAEGVPLSIIYADNDGNGGAKTNALSVLKNYAGSSTTVTPDPDVIGWCQDLLGSGQAAEAQAVLDAIANDPTPAPLMPFKSIISAAVDDTTLTLPNNSTVLRVTGSDHANGDTIYTWRKVSGPSAVTFGPNNGTAAGTVTSVTLDGLLGTYQFQVTMSDSRGLTEVYQTVEVLFGDGTGPDVAPPNPDRMTWASVPRPVAGGTPLIYEPFDYPAGGLDGQGGTSDFGFDGPWNAKTSALVDVNDLSYGKLATTGGSIGGLNGGSNNFGGARTVSPSTLAANGLLDDGATLWFSLEMGYDVGGNVTNSRLCFAFANDSFNEGNYNYWINDDGAQLGSGLGVVLGRDGTNGKIAAVQYRDIASGDALVGNVYGNFSESLLSGGEHTLVIGKITWGAGSDTIEIYVPDTSLNPGQPISTLTVSVDQSVYDTVTWARGDKVVMDEIRFGATYDDVTIENVGDLTMTASTANDPSGAEYYFTCTSGGGNDSGWQDSPVYTDTGLTFGTEYTYTVMARDFSPARNTTEPSIAKSATPGDPVPSDIDFPTPNPAAFASAPAADSNTSITMTAATGTDATGPVEYLFKETSGNPGGTSRSWQTDTTYTDTGLTTGLSYTYTVTMRDALGNTSDASDGASAFACFNESDLNNDCEVNFADFAKLGMGWLTTYDISDLALMAQNWLVNE